MDYSKSGTSKRAPSLQHIGQGKPFAKIHVCDFSTVWTPDVPHVRQVH